MIKKIEICCFSLYSAKVASASGASRIELCGGFLEGGTTPSSGLVKQVLAAVDIPVYVMIRPRGGDFCYSKDEEAVIFSDIQEIKKINPAGFVFGALNANGTVNQNLSRKVINACAPYPVTFHRAIDVSRDLKEALELIIELGYERVLSSGAKASVEEGYENLVALHEQGAGRIEVMAGAGLNRDMLKKLSEAGLYSFHASAKEWVPSLMEFKNREVSMASGAMPDEFGRYESQEERIKNLLKE